MDYDKGKRGFIIWIGDAVKNYLKHKFKSTIGSGKDEDLGAKAKSIKRQILPRSPRYAQRHDPRIRRMELHTTIRKTLIQEDLSAVDHSSVDLGEEFIPRNTRWVREQYQYNVSIVYWKVETG